MTRSFSFLSYVFGSTSALLFLLSLLSVSPQSASAEDPQQCGPTLPKCPAGMVCADGICVWPVCSPATFLCIDDGTGTACTPATDQVPCYTPDPLCKCRARNSNGCNCGY